ncbi:cell envelope integrity protein TolA [Aureimonas populi]|uniref:Cell envelope integrity protein TolA n=1 Tax=Aureimonas populi TaxID=1701758 RepID=A0ABW5CFT0_9HYPH|nr:cell envelope integrity protein TolA [Aureimonas populi]
MKPFVTSTVLHTALLTWGLWSFGQPAALDLTQGESLPVSIVPIEEYSASMVGESEAEMTDTPAPEPTQTPETLPMPAENIGENEVDLASPPRPETAPRDRVQTATAEAPPPPPPPPAPEPEPTPEPEPEPEPAPVPVPEPEVSEPAPAPEPMIDEAAPELAETPPEPEPTPQNVPRPVTRPAPPVRTAEAPRQTPPAEPARQTPREDSAPTQSQSEREPEFDADEIAALLDRQNSAGGGAQRSDAQASLGGTRNTGQRLSQSELDALRGQIARCWNPPAGVMEAGSLRVSIQMSLDQTGALQGMPQIVSGSGSSSAERAAGEAALRAVRRCAPYNLPIEKYETWSQVQINFDPSEMF